LRLLLSDLVLSFACFVGALYLILPMDPVVFILYDGGLGRISAVVAVLMLGIYFQDLYSNLLVPSRMQLVQQVVLCFGLIFIVQALLSYVDPQLMMPRWALITGSAMALVVLPAWRIAYARYLLLVQHAERILFLGCTTIAPEIEKRLLEKPQLGMSVAGYVDDGTVLSDPLPPEKILGSLGEFPQVVESVNPDRVVVALSERRGRMPPAELLRLRLSGVFVQEVAELYELAFDRVCLRELRPSQLIFARQPGPRASLVLLQTIYSLIIAAVGLVVTLPLSLIVACLVKLTSSGPVLHRQVRVGRNGAPFTLYKFRSMYDDAEAETGAVWASKNDPRITPVGRWLRLFRLDEIPQMLNVLRGEMSFVGPRPERPEFVETFSEQIPFYRQRLSVKPGVTGWAQINHKYGDTIEDAITKLEYDLYYVKNISPALDAYVIFQTIKVILLARGAQ